MKKIDGPCPLYNSKKEEQEQGKTVVGLHRINAGKSMV